MKFKAFGMNPSSDEPFITYNILGICGLIFVFVNLYSGTEMFSQSLNILAPDSVWIWHGRIWGLVTAAFVHINFIHFLFNMWWAYEFGRMFERKLGPLYYILFVVLAAIASSGAQIAFTGQNGIGYSGVVYALFGFAWTARHIEPDFYEVVHEQVVRLFLFWLGFCFVLDMTGVMNIGNAAHVCGLVFGWCAGNVFIRRKYVWESKAGLVCLTVIALMSVFYLPWFDRWNDRHIIINYWQAKENAKEGDAEAQRYYAQILREEGLNKASLQWFKEAAEQQNVIAKNGLAWIYATHPNEEFRNGEEAVRLAEEVCEEDGWKTPAFIDTLAAAYAEVGRWDDAVTTQELAIQKLSDNDWDAYGYRERLKKMRNQEKIRE